MDTWLIYLKYISVEVQGTGDLISNYRKLELKEAKKKLRSEIVWHRFFAVPAFYTSF